MLKKRRRYATMVVFIEHNPKGYLRWSLLSTSQLIIPSATRALHRCQRFHSLVCHFVHPVHPLHPSAINTVHPSHKYPVHIHHLFSSCCIVQASQIEGSRSHTETFGITFEAESKLRDSRPEIKSLEPSALACADHMLLSYPCSVS